MTLTFWRDAEGPYPLLIDYFPLGFTCCFSVLRWGYTQQVAAPYGGRHPLRTLSLEHFIPLLPLVISQAWCWPITSLWMTISFPLLWERSNLWAIILWPWKCPVPHQPALDLAPLDDSCLCASCKRQFSSPTSSTHSLHLSALPEQQPTSSPIYRFIHLSVSYPYGLTDFCILHYLFGCSNCHLESFFFNWWQWITFIVRSKNLSKNFY